MLLLKEIEQKYKVLKHDDKHMLYKQFDYCGYLTSSGHSYTYHGVADYTAEVNSMKELNDCIDAFVQECNDKWIDSRAMDPSNNKGYVVELALAYMVRKFGWKPVREFSSDYLVASKSFGAELMTIKSQADYGTETCKFFIGYNGGWFSESPDFNDYLTAIDWLKSVIGSVVSAVGIELLSTAVNNNMISAEASDVMMKKINFSTQSIDSMSLKEYLIDMLEKQLERLKR